MSFSLSLLPLPYLRLPSSKENFVRCFFSGSENFVARLGSVSFNIIYRASRQRTSLGVSFPVRRTSFRDLVACQEIIERASRQGTLLDVTLEETLVACHRRQPVEYRTKSQENFVGNLVSLS